MIGLQGWVAAEPAGAVPAPAWLSDDEGGSWQCFAGEGWTFRARRDATYVIESLGDGVVIHDGRVRRWEADPREWSGSFLALEPHGAGAGLEIVNDRMGSVPLYWGARDGGLAFSSRLSDLARFGFTEPDEIAALQVVLLNQPLWDRTLLKGPRLMEPASRLALRPGTTARSERYWSIPAIPREDGRDDRSLLNDAVGIFQRAHRQLADDATESVIGFPVTAGLDSRCILAMHRERLDRAHLFHDVTHPGERKIARRIADYLGRPLEIYRADPRVWVELPQELETGELNAAQWWFWTTAQAVRRDGCEQIFDGYLNDSLFNSYLIRTLPASFTAARLDGPRYRYSLLGGDCESRRFGEFAAVYVEGFASVDGDPLERNQRFSLENRSRRYTFGMVRMLQNCAKIRLPGLDRDLLEFGLSLPWRLRRDGALYRRMIARLDPGLARIPSGRTGLPLTSPRRISLRNRLRNSVQPNLIRAADRLWPARPVLLSPRRPLERSLLDDPGFRGEIKRLLDRSEWVGNLFGEAVAERLFDPQPPGSGDPRGHVRTADPRGAGARRTFGRKA